MPGRKPAAEKPMCELCCDAIEKGQDTLQCEGECHCVVHRYCAGVTKRHFESLKKGHSPFVCQWCYMKVSRAMTEKLQSQVASLQSELAATKEIVAKQSEQTAHMFSSASYASVASQPPYSQERRQQRQRRGQRQGPFHRAVTNNVQRTSSQASTSVAETSTAATRSSTATTNVTTPQARVRVEGARRIWGTHPHATTKTVENAIGRFCNVQGLRIKRKTSRNVQTRKSSWWFVIHAEETVLQELDD